MAGAVTHTFQNGFKRDANKMWLLPDGNRWTMVRWGDISHLTRDAALDDF